MQVLYFFESIRNEALTAFFSFVTHGGEELFLLGMICLLYWCLDKKLACRLAMAYFVSGLTVQTLKITFRIDRPWVLDPAFTPVPSALTTATGYSFPSGHTQSATAFFGTLWYRDRKRLRSLLWLFVIVLVGTSRMYLGVHTPADVLVSFAVSTVLILLVNRFLTESMCAGYDKVITLCMAAISIGVMCYALILYGNTVIEQKYAADCCKAAGAGLGFALAWFCEGRYIHFTCGCKKWWQHVIKYALGLLGVLLLKEGLKLLSHSLPMDFARYFAMVVWGIAGLPLLWMKLFHRWVKERD